MVRARRTAAEVAALKAEQRTTTARRADVEADRRARPAPQPKPAPSKPAYAPVVRQHLEGEKPGPLFGDVVPVPDWADIIMFDNHNARLADVHLEASVDAETWSPMPPGHFRRAVPAT